MLALVFSLACVKIGSSWKISGGILQYRQFKDSQFNKKGDVGSINFAILVTHVVDKRETIQASVNGTSIPRISRIPVADDILISSITMPILFRSKRALLDEMTML